MGKLDGAAMIRVYSTENATQRGNSGTAIAGSVANAIRFLIKDILTGGKHVSQFYDTSQRAIDTLKGQIASEKGLGETNYYNARFLDGSFGVMTFLTPKGLVK